VRLELVLVPYPGQENGGSPSGDARRRAQASAESLLVAVRGGAPLDSIAQRLGGERDAGWWTAGQTTGVFGEDPELGAAALAAEPGDLLGRPLRVITGYALVRVAQREPGRVTPLAQVADSVRQDYLRVERVRQARAQVETLRAAHPESFHATCTTWHAALIDTGRMIPRTPSASALRDWYAKHGAEFARLDPEGRGVTQPALAEVEDVARARFLEGERWRLAADVAARLTAAWGKGRRDAKAEKLAEVWYGVRTVGPETPPAGVPQAIVDSVQEAPVGRAASFPGSRGLAVYAITSRDSACVLTDSLATARAARLLAEERPAQEEAAAHAYFDAHRERYLTEPTYNLTFLRVDPRPFLVLDIPRSAVERYYREHPQEFGQQEEAHVRHILVATPPRADSTAARARALELLAAVRAGADFDSLARAVSQDPISRDHGGDLGWVRRGDTEPGFEAAAFSVAPGNVVGPVRSRFGYHLIQGIEKHEENLTPLRIAYGIAGQKEAAVWADSLARAFADSVIRRARTSADLGRIGAPRAYTVEKFAWLPGGRTEGPTSDPRMQQDLRARSRPGILPRVYEAGSNVYAAWLDSISPPGPSTWELAREKALADYRHSLVVAQAERALQQVREELSAGVPWDSAGAPWGGGLGFSHRRGSLLPGIQDAAQVDSLLYGSPAKRLADGQAAVLAGEHGAALVEVIHRVDNTGQVSTQEREQLRQALGDRAFYDYFEKLKVRYPVRILRRDLRIALPTPAAL
jgi:parvulin-like peptidyl-prolyl isomerase